ncbi:hypothetical protein BD410DRAFT_18545 [Rickenella mellea]|uniref:Uncharacterized protein n=1 Tax=Rickenella mellea TaxID=50990 RepID=A0A4R5XEC4_9AGAM|nr:hypothetical protein BD410DRAFT_18545 [Rickenella mellea]
MDQLVRSKDFLAIKYHFGSPLIVPNRVPQRQREFQNSHIPLWRRSPRSNLYLTLWYSGLSVGIVGITLGVVQMIKGKPKEA